MLRTLPLALACTLTLGAAAQAQTELIVNGGFEQFDAGNGNLPTGWTLSAQPLLGATGPLVKYGSFDSTFATTFPANGYGSFYTFVPPLSGQRSLYGTELNSAEAAMWQAWTLPRAALASATLSFRFSGQFVATTSPTDQLKISLANPALLPATPSASLVTLFSANAATTAIIPVTTISVNLLAANLAALRYQPTALAFYVTAEANPVTIQADDVSLTYVLAQLGRTPNQQAAYGALLTSASAGATTALGLLSNYGTGAQQSALNNLGAPVYGEALLAGLGRARAFGDLVEDQLSARRGLAAAPGSIATVPDLAGVTTWATVLSGAARSGAGGNTGGASSGTGFALGADRMVADGLRLGVAGGFVTGRADSRLTGGSSESNTLMLGAYGGWSMGMAFVDAQAFGTYQDDSVRRDLGALGAGRVSGSAESLGGSAGLESGVHLRVGAFDLQPSASIRVDTLSRAPLNETSGDLALAVKQDSATSARAGVNLRASTDLPVGAYVVTARLRVGYAHELADATTQTDASFQGGGSAFRVVSARTGRDAAVLGGGLAMPVAPGLAVHAGYGAELRSRYTGQTASVGLRMTF